MTQSQSFDTIFEYMRRQAESEAQQRYAHAIHEMEQRFLRRDYPNLKDRIQAHVDKGEPIPKDLQADYINASILTGNLDDILKGFKPKKKDERKGLKLDPNVEKLIYDEAEKIGKTSFVPALVLDAIGVLGNSGSLDSVLTPAVMAGGMAGYLGGRHHLVDGPISALAGCTLVKAYQLGLDYLKDGSINESQPGLVSYLAAYAIAATAGKAVQYAKNNWETKIKPALTEAGKTSAKVLGNAAHNYFWAIYNSVYYGLLGPITIPALLIKKHKAKKSPSSLAP